jgi:hypothetical protein
MEEWHIKFVGFVCVINEYNVLIGLCKLNRLWIGNKEMASPILGCNIDFQVYSLVLKVLDKGIICRKTMFLLSFKRGI